MGELLQTFSFIGALSAFIVALIVAITSLNISSKVAYVEGWIKRLGWLSIGGVVFGVGIALVNLVATQSLNLPFDISYNVPLLFITLALAILGSMVALYYVSQKQITRVHVCLGGFAVGIGIVLLYRNWFLAVNLEIAALNEIPILIILILISVIMSIAVIWITNHLRNHPKTTFLRKNIMSGVVIGVAITGFYYSATLATFVFSREVLQSFGASQMNSFFLAYAIGLITIIILGYVLIHEYMESKLSVHRQKLMESDRKYASLFQHSHDAIIALSKEGHVLEINPAGLAMIGFLPQELQSIELQKLLLPEYIDLTIKNFFATLEGESTNYDIAITAKHGNTVFINITNVPMYSDGEIIGAYFICRDITERVQAEQQIEHMAYHDALTGLGNLRLFEKQVAKAKKSALSKQHSFAILFLDMDHFKEVNDTLGHAYGDLLLQQISKRLEEIVGKQGAVARRGGDEFTILLSKATREQAEVLAKTLVHEIAKPYNLKGNHVSITTCIGIALYPDHGLEYEILLKYADQAMYRAKENGKNCYVFYQVDNFANMMNK